MADAAIDDLLHRLNNLLGAIAMQGEVAAAVGTLEAHQQALRIISESAERMHEEVKRFRQGGDEVRSADRSTR
jgi:hypothetical protein